MLVWGSFRMVVSRVCVKEGSQHLFVPGYVVFVFFSKKWGINDKSSSGYPIKRERKKDT